MLQVSVSEADYVLEEERRVLVWGEHLESEQANSDNVVAEDESAEDIGILTILLIRFFVALTTGHHLNDMQDLIEELQGCVKLFI